MLETTFWTRIFTKTFKMMIVTSNSRGLPRSEATSCLRLSRSSLKVLTFIEDKEKRAVSEAEKKPEAKISTHKRETKIEITKIIPCYFENRPSIVLQEQRPTPSSKSSQSKQDHSDY